MPECYMCNAKATTTEHVPPKCIFPEKKDLPEGLDLRKKLITVSACDIHNTKKSKDDEYILYIMVMNFLTNKTGRNQFFTKLLRAIERNPKLIKQFLDGNKQVVIENLDTNELENTISINVDIKRFDSAIDMIARALYFHHYKEKWLESIAIQTDFLLFENDTTGEYNALIADMAAAADCAFKHSECFGENPEVFKYQFVKGDGICPLLLRLHFYENSTITVFYGFKKP